MADYVLITGASGGIGEAFAHQFAKDGISPILVARNNDQLERVKAEIINSYGVDARVYSADLTNQTSVQELYNWTKAEDLNVRYLINNAGFGDRANVLDAELNRLHNMIQLNIDSLVALSKLYGADMAERGQGNIVNIASIAGFVPGPGMAVYYATKAFVLSFSQALSAELEDKGVVVTTVCPGATKTGFATAARANKARIFSGKLPTSEQVASWGYKAMKKGTLVAVWGATNRIMSRLVSLAPRRQLVRAVRRVQ